MSTKDWKNKEISTLLSEAWGFKFNTLEEFNEFNGNGEVQTEAEEEVQTEGEEETVDEGEDHDDEDKMEEGEDREDDDDAGESLEEGFMDTMRKVGRSVGGAVTGSTAVRERLAGYIEEIKAALAEKERPQYDVRSLRVPALLPTTLCPISAQMLVARQKHFHNQKLSP